MDNYEGSDPWNTSSNAWTKDDDHVVSTTNSEPSLNGISGEFNTLNFSTPLDTNEEDTGFLPTNDVLEESIWDDSRNPLSATGMSQTPNIAANETVIDKNDARDQNIEESEADLLDWTNNVRKTYRPLDADIIIIEEIPEREGLLFKHANYLVKHLIALPSTSPSEERTVVRRYSDFLWLREILLKRYPFRMIPELPPKRIGSQNADQLFLKKRKIGLSRFINLVMKHPKLSNDDLVLTFLTVRTDLTSWRKQATYDTSNEFADKKISQEFMKMWKKEFAEQWNQAASCIDTSMELWYRITLLLERHEKRIMQMVHERNFFETLVDNFSEVTPKLYPVQQNDTILDINNNLSIIKKHLETTSSICKQETEEISGTLSPKFKIFTDILLSLRSLFERYKIMAANNVVELQRHVELNKEKLESMKGKPDVSGAEYDRIKKIIQKDRRSIIEQSNRAWLIRQCILEEFTIFQETQFLITRAFQDWAKLNSNHAGLKLNGWEKLVTSIMDMPISRE
ncbi:XXYS1_4_G0024920.mRNA.1.CDS.1 [Saccharomyces cerevisiae]|nr:EM14S01-3B_G0022330.mRNA.1.CDS.1 [Saccharomyces cerevisiae]CAD6641128.1 XXYS1_4_G0024920.mRNA.1.CDS.1 [Saccharomyces cerevisiae]CAI4623064.1 AMH_1a_G0040290.mRNA.1.CDS.1 [Saccharomyces cerevisiae]CAI4624456.1 CEI_1a_G0040190.mRNA.1.CDS.1 [Saccharomyces cerevisiae]CAI6791655.1 AMH_1a_G0040290.mRNA.1.CDS.1 [Saccharomyces cerevisiae]